MSDAFTQELEEAYGGTFTKYLDVPVDDILRERATHAVLVKYTMWNRADPDRKPLWVGVQEIPRGPGPVWPPRRCWMNGVQFRPAGPDEPPELWWSDLLQGDVNAPVGMVPAAHEVGA